MKRSFTVAEIAAVCDQIEEDLQKDGVPPVQMNIVTLAFLILRATLSLPSPEEGTYVSSNSLPKLMSRRYTLPSEGIIEIDYEEVKKRLSQVGFTWHNPLEESE